MKWSYAIYLVLVLLICGRFAMSTYAYLAGFANWQSPWKRLLAISPVLIGMALVASLFFVLPLPR